MTARERECRHEQRFAYEDAKWRRSRAKRLLFRPPTRRVASAHARVCVWSTSGNDACAKTPKTLASSSAEACGARRRRRCRQRWRRRRRAERGQRAATFATLVADSRADGHRPTRRRRRRRRTARWTVAATAIKAAARSRRRQTTRRPSSPASRRVARAAHCASVRVVAPRCRRHRRD